MSNLSLLVDCKKIIRKNCKYLEWLQQRKKLPNQWYNYVKAAQEKTKQLIKQKQQFKNYPELYAKIDQNSESFCFYDVADFVSTLLNTQLARQKSMIFGYTNSSVKQWVRLGKFMASKNVGLLSNSKFIEQTIKFDLPAINKNIEMMEAQSACIKRKIDFNQNTIFQQQQEMKKQILSVGLSLHQIDLRSFSVKNEFPRIMAKIPQTIANIQTFVQTIDLRRLVQIYRQKCAKQGLEFSMLLLEYFISNKNQYVDVYRGIANKNQFLTQKYQEFTNWNATNEWDIRIQNEQQKSSLANSLNSVTILEDRQTRQQLLYNLNQLMYFYVGLKFQLSQNSRKLQVDDSNMTEREIQASISQVEQLIFLVNSKQLVTPLQVKNNRKSYQYFVMKFHNIEKNIETLQRQIQNYRTQVQEIQSNKNVQIQKLRRLRSKTVQVKKKTEKLLSELVGKEVKIVGEVNKLQ